VLSALHDAEVCLLTPANRPHTRMHGFAVARVFSKGGAEGLRVLRISSHELGRLAELCYLTADPGHTQAP